MNSLRRYTLSLLITFLSVGACLYAQNDVQISSPYFNPYGINPAFAGMYDELDMTALIRKQWAGLNESPTVQQVNAHIPFDILRGGIGIMVNNQTSGAERWTTAKLGYAYHLKFNEYTQLNIGGAVGFINSSIDGSKLRTPDGTYINGVINHADADLPLGNVSSTGIIGDLGAFLVVDRWKASVSVLGLFGNNLTYEPGLTTSFLDQRTLNVFLAYNLDLTPSIRVFPHVFVKSDFNRTQTEIHTTIRYNDNLIVGGGLRGYDASSLDAFIATVGVELKNGMTLLYAYDNTLSTLNTVSSGSHEFIIKYNIDTNLGKGRPPGIIYNPRNL